MTAPAPSERVCSVCDFDPENPDEGDGTVQDCLVPECPLRKAATTPTTPQYSALADELDEYAEKSIMVEGPRLAREAAAALRTAESFIKQLEVTLREVVYDRANSEAAAHMNDKTWARLRALLGD